MTLRKAFIGTVPDTLTANAAPAFSTTGNSVLNFFATVGSMRGADHQKYIDLFEPAWRENPGLALKALFWSRDCTSGFGAGEREPMRAILPWLAERGGSDGKMAVLKNLYLLSKYGYWKDIILLLDGPLRDRALQIISIQFKSDLADARRGDSVSLLGKYLPSESSKSAEVRARFRLIRDHLGISSKLYRKQVALLRKAAPTVEQALSQGFIEDWDYSRTPSKAAMRYRRAFANRDGARYAEFVGKVESGEEKMNTRGLQPHEFVKISRYHQVDAVDAALQAQWTQLVRDTKQWLQESECSILPIGDASGSMYSPGGYGYLDARDSKILPIQVSAALTVLLAQANPVDAFKGLAISFDSRPSFLDLGSLGLNAALREFVKHSGLSTDLNRTFRELLDRARRASLTNEEMPDVVLIISDMEFNNPSVRGNKTPFERIRADYAAAGFSMPKVVFWKVDAKRPQHPVTMFDGMVALVSGFSADVLRGIITGDLSMFDPYSRMTAVLERYEDVVL